MDTHRDRHPHPTRRTGWHPWGRCTVQPVTRALRSGRTLEVHDAEDDPSVVLGYD